MGNEARVISIVIKRGDSWLFGRVKKSGKFKIKRTIKNLEDIVDVDNYKSLGECLQGEELSRALKRMKAQKAFYLLKSRKGENENEEASN